MNTRIDLLSLNVRHCRESGANARERRVERIGRIIADHQPAVVGFQEVRPWWMGELGEGNRSLADVLPENYEIFCRYRNEKEVVLKGLPEKEKEGSAICYDRTVVKKLEEGVFWLSDTPAVESQYEEDIRFALWAKFELLATGEPFYFLSTHLGLRPDIQELQLKCLSREMDRLCEQYGPAPMAVCGDFNIPDTAETYKVAEQLFVDAGALLGDGVTPTFPHWGHHFDDGYRIDYFFSKGPWKPVQYEVDARVFDPETEEMLTLDTKPEQYAYGYCSDHAPVLVQYEFNQT